jgi:hypothetical protein
MKDKDTWISDESQIFATEKGVPQQSTAAEAGGGLIGGVIRSLFGG